MYNLDNFSIVSQKLLFNTCNNFLIKNLSKQEKIKNTLIKNSCIVLIQGLQIYNSLTLANIIFNVQGLSRFTFNSYLIGFATPLVLRAFVYFNSKNHLEENLNTLDGYMNKAHHLNALVSAVALMSLGIPLISVVALYVYFNRLLAYSVHSSVQNQHQKKLSLSIHDEGKTKPSLNELLPLFDKINFDSPDQPDYFSPDAIPENRTVQEIRKGLEEFVNNSIHLVEGETAKRYTKDYLEKIIQQLPLLSNNERSMIIVNLAVSGLSCISHRQAAIQQAYQTMTHQLNIEDCSLEGQLKRKLTQLKQTIFFQIAAEILKDRKFPPQLISIGYFPTKIYNNQISDIEAHDLNYCLELFGEECEMFGVELAKNDWIGNLLKQYNPTHPATAKQLFQQKFNKQTIVQAVCKELNTIGSSFIEKDKVYEWFKKNPPKNFKKDYMNDILDEVDFTYKPEAIERMLHDLNLLPVYS